MSHDLLHGDQFYIIHTGVKGMKWGVRKDFKTARRNEKKLAKFVGKEFKSTRRKEKEIIGKAIVKTIEAAAKSDQLVSNLSTAQKLVIDGLLIYGSYQLAGVVYDKAFGA
jgi:hypothetical protein